MARTCAKSRRRFRSGIHGRNRLPYLAPVPFRGKRCEPAHTRIVAETIAAARGMSLQEIAEATTETAEKFFRFKR